MGALRFATGQCHFGAKMKVYRPRGRRAGCDAASHPACRYGVLRRYLRYRWRTRRRRAAHNALTMGYSTQIYTIRCRTLLAGVVLLATAIPAGSLFAAVLHGCGSLWPLSLPYDTPAASVVLQGVVPAVIAASMPAMLLGAADLLWSLITTLVMVGTNSKDKDFEFCEEEE